MVILLAKIPYKKVQKWENKPPNFCTVQWNFKLTFMVRGTGAELSVLLQQRLNNILEFQFVIININ